MYEALTELMPVDVLVLQEGSEDRAVPGDRPEILARLCWKPPPRMLYKYGTHRWVDEWCHSNVDWSKYALVVGREFTSITKVSLPPHLRTIVDCDDALYKYTPKTQALAHRAIASARGWLRFWQTKMAIRRFDHAFFCTARDLALFPCRSSSILPNVVHAAPVQSAESQGVSGTALVVGSMWYAPNRQGIDWFLEHCWPAVAARCPQLTLRIIGAAPPEERRRWEKSTRTEAPGFVDDLSAEYARALFVIASVHYGGGTCIKFLESAAFRKPCVVTDYVYAGFKADFQDGHSVMVGRNAGQFSHHCVKLYDDAKQRRTIADHAYEIVTRLYTVSRFNSTVQITVRNLLAASTA